MENPRIVVNKTVVIANHSMEKILVLCQGGNSCQKPAVAESTLLHIEPGKPFDEKSRVVCNFFRSQPFAFKIKTSRKGQTFVISWKLRIFKKLLVDKALFTNFGKILVKVLAQ